MASLQGHIPAALTSQQQQPEPRQQRRHSISQGQQPSIHQLYPSSSEYTQTSSHTGSTDSKAGCPQKSRITEINPEWGLTKAGKTRQRLPLACQVCRKKKIRCSGEQPICKHCQRFSLPCVYKTTTTRRPRNSSRKESTASGGEKRRASKTESLESSTPSPQPSHAIDINRTQHLPSLSSSINPNLFYNPFVKQEAQAAATFGHQPGPTSTRPPGPVRVVTGPASTSSGLMHPEMFGPSHPKSTQLISHHRTSVSAVREPPLPPHPPTPPLMNIPSPSESVPSTKVEPHTPLPSRTTLLKLVEIYFTHVNNQTYGFLHRPTFLRHLEEGKVPEGLLYSICAIAARFSQTHAPPPLSKASSKEIPPYHAGEPYAVEARRLALRDFDKPTVQNVQNLLLLALHDFGGKKGQKAWMFAGMAIRMASALRLNREVDGDPIGVEHGPSTSESSLAFGLPETTRTSREKMGWTEREIRRRTFWACFVMDRLNSTGMERPHMIQETDCLVQLPTAERSFVFGIPIRTERLVPPPPSKLDSSSSLHPRTHSMGSEAYLVRIVALWGRVTKYVNQGGRLYDVSPPWKPDSGFAKLSKDLQEWLNGLPYWLKYSSSNLADQVAISQAPSFVFMHVAYHTIVCTLHRFSVPSANTSSEPQLEEPTLPSWNPPQEFLEESVKTCFTHARAISTIMAEVLSRSDCVVTAPFLGFAMFTANLFHLHQAFTPCPYVDEGPEEAREFFATGVTVLNELRLWWGPLEMLYKAIRILWQAKARNSQAQLFGEQTPKATTPTAPAFEAQQQAWTSGPGPIASGSTPRPFWMPSQPNSPGRGEHFDTTGFIPLPGGNFGLDFFDPNLYMDTENFGEFNFDNGHLETLTNEPQYMYWGNVSPTPFGGGFESNFNGGGDNGKSPAPPNMTPGRPLSPFSSALHGFGQNLVRNGRDGVEESPVLTKKDTVDEPKSILESIHKDENSVMPPPNLTPRGVTSSTPGTVAGVSSVSPTSGASVGHVLPPPAKPQDEDKGEEGSEGEEAADLLVYFHARSGAAESAAIDDSNEVPGDEPRPGRAMSGSSASPSPAAAGGHDLMRKRKRNETAEQPTSHPNPSSMSQMGAGSIYSGKSDGRGTTKE